MEPVLPPGGAFAVEPHAAERMAELGITEAHVRRTLERPGEVLPADDRPPTGRVTSTCAAWERAAARSTSASAPIP